MDGCEGQPWIRHPVMQEPIKCREWHYQCEETGRHECHIAPLRVGSADDPEPYEIRCGWCQSSARMSEAQVKKTAGCIIAWPDGL